MNVRRLTRIVYQNASESSPLCPATRAAEETVALVLDEEAPVLDSAQDVTDLAMRLRGHLMQLGPLTAAQTTSNESLHKALAEAQRLADEEAPADFMPARVHLRRFAQAVQEVLGQLSSAEAAGQAGPYATPNSSTSQWCHAAGESSECPHTPNCPPRTAVGARG